jgi:hypothetical protein
MCDGSGAASPHSALTDHHARIDFARIDLFQSFGKIAGGARASMVGKMRAGLATNKYVFSVAYLQIPKDGRRIDGKDRQVSQLRIIDHANSEAY